MDSGPAGDSFLLVRAIPDPVEEETYRWPTLGKYVLDSFPDMEVLMFDQLRCAIPPECGKKRRCGRHLRVRLVIVRSLQLERPRACIRWRASDTAGSWRKNNFLLTLSPGSQLPSDTGSPHTLT